MNLRPKTSQRERRTGQRGLSLVELMIALTIGLVIVTAAGYIYATSKRSFRTADGLDRMQESTRGALLLMNTVIRNAGFLPDSLYHTDPTKYFSNTVVAGVNTLAIFGGNGAPPFLPSSAPFPSTKSDWIAVTFVGCASNTAGNTSGCFSDATTYPATVYVGGGGSQIVNLRSCAGDTVPNTSKYANFLTQAVVNVFFVGTDSAVANNSSPVANLYCSSYYYDISNPAAPVAISPAWTTQTLLQGVNNISVLYGIDPKGDRHTAQYLQANQMSNTTWPQVSAVQITLTTQNDSKLAFGNASNSKNVANGFLQAQQTQTIAIRNRLQ